MADRKVFANQGPTKPDVPKSTFDLSHAYNGSFRVGRAYPTLCYEAPAGSSFKIKPYVALDMMPLAFPIQTNMKLHMSFYKIPFRILLRTFKEMVGQRAADGSPATPQTEHRMPFIARPSGWHKTGSLADYMGLPSEVITSRDALANLYRSDFFQFLRHPTNGGVQAEVNNFHVSSVLRSIFAGSLSDVSYFTGFFLSPIQVGNLPSTNFRIDFEITSVDEVTDLPALYYRPFKFLKDRNDINLVACFDSEGDTIPFSDLTLSPVLDSSIKLSGNNYYTTKVHVVFSSSQLAFLKTLPSPFALCFYWQSVDKDGNISVYGHYDYDPVQHVTKINSINQVSSTEFSSGSGELTPASSNGFGIMENFLLNLQKVYGSSSEQMFSVNSDPNAPNNGLPFLPINALPFRAYEFIHQYFFNNERITPFRPNGGNPVYNQFITNDGEGSDSTTPVDFWNVPYEYDLFTTCVKNPQFGNAPLVGITTNSEGTAANFIMNNISVTDSDNQTVTRNIGVALDPETHRILQISNYDEVADMPSVLRLQDAIQYGISINDFRNVNALQRFQERMLKAGDKYQNIVFEFFGTNPPIGEEFPEYLGGFTTSLNVSKVMSLAATQDAKLGDFCGQGNISGKGGTIKCFCAEQSYIMGIMYITCTPAYSQMLPRHFTKSQILDYANPQFANLSLQPVYNHQLAPLQLNPNDVGSVFGYNRPYSEYVSCQDEVHGLFRTSLANYLMQRIFSSKPELGEDFLYIKSEDLTDVWQSTDDDDKFYGQIWFDMRAKLPIPRFSIPRII